MGGGQCQTVPVKEKKLFTTVSDLIPLGNRSCADTPEQRAPGTAGRQLVYGLLLAVEIFAQL